MFQISRRCFALESGQLQRERQKEINNFLMISPAMFQPQMDLTDIHLERKVTRANVTLMSSFLVR